MSNANQAGASPDSHDLEPLHELEPLPEPVPGPAPEPRQPGAPRPSGPRELERAPLLLQKAALILLVSAVLPWLVPVGFTLPVILAKVFVLAGGYLVYCAIEHAIGVKTPLDALANTHERALPIVGYLLILIGVSPLIESFFVAKLGANEWKGIVEKAALAIGFLAWAQVHGYSRTGKFNPIWALIIPLFGIAGLSAAVVTLLGIGNGSIETSSGLFTVLGALGVTGAGAFSAYTLFLAIKDAKAHGEMRKREASEQRMRERKEKRDRGPGAPQA